MSSANIFFFKFSPSTISMHGNYSMVKVREIHKKLHKNIKWQECHDMTQPNIKYSYVVMGEEILWLQLISAHRSRKGL